MNQLGGRLESVSVSAATLCYMCACNADKVVEMWTRVQQEKGKQKDAKQADKGDNTLALHAAVEKIAVFAQTSQAAGQRPSRAITAKYSEYASLLAAQGCLSGAWDYLRIACPVPTAEDEEAYAHTHTHTHTRNA